MTEDLMALFDGDGDGILDFLLRSGAREAPPEDPGSVLEDPAEPGEALDLGAFVPNPRIWDVVP